MKVATKPEVNLALPVAPERDTVYVENATVIHPEHPDVKVEFAQVKQANMEITMSAQSEDALESTPRLASYD